MTQIHWKSAVSADFNTAADWSTGNVPGAADDAILDATGGAFTVSTSTAETVNSIQTAANATLDYVLSHDLQKSAGVTLDDAYFGPAPKPAPSLVPQATK